MNDHVTEWLGAYHDGELQGARRQQVERHLSGCPDCRAELESLASLSQLLSEAPALPRRTPPERFAAQVQLRLAPRPATAPRPAWVMLGGLLGVWVFLQAALIVVRVGLWAAPLAGIPIPPGWFPGQATVQLLVLDVAFSAVIAALVWAWLAGWWAARWAARPKSNGLMTEANG